MNQTELYAWIAGLFEGEGSAFIGNRGGNRQGVVPKVTICSTDRELLLPVKGAFGGCLHREYRRKDCKDGYERKPILRWEASCLLALRFAKETFPYCKSVKSKAKLSQILKYYEVHRQFPQRSRSSYEFRRWTPKEVIRLLEMRGEGRSYDEIARGLGRSKKACWTRKYLAKKKLNPRLHRKGERGVPEEIGTPVRRRSQKDGGFALIRQEADGGEKVGRG